MFHVDVSYIIISMINILVLFLFLKVFLFQRVGAVIEERQRTIERSLQDADLKKTEAYQLKQDYENDLKQAGNQAGIILKEAKERAEIEYVTILSEAKKEAAKTMEESRKAIELEREKSVEMAKSEIASVALLAASKVVGKNVDDDTNQQYLGDFLKEVGAAK
ncbi:MULTISPECIES: F0F1 ATP synthase subunit B [Anaerotignum]|uniref:F0F1 ATP synthase subunit B n=1 Tax=Anaerotignum TaxID=2039240 RepID=UPI002109831E|nr:MULTISPECIES: F0F1 ATP synthase subunit B [Anaerotignum]MCQ4937304.1 F0F1 ATP synthase subunit B [Anaerotignum propionicum]